MDVTKHIISVSELNRVVKRIFDTEEILNNILIRGEISNLSTYSSGHLYFTLKDENAQISATMFKTYVTRLRFRPENGLKVIVQGKVSLYEARGTYQINIVDMEPDGYGALALRYEQLKKKLEEQGYFDESRKKELPLYPKSIGVITSPTGAAICDIINILTRRWPLCEIKVYPAIVQGQTAPESLINGVKFFNEHNLCDVIIIGRGGGSIEDLWGFNDEMLVKTIYASKIPIVSAVGHESDFTLCDFVSDKRAPTPSAAAELTTPSINDMYGQLSNYNIRLNNAIKRKLDVYKEKVDKLSKNRMLVNPMLFVQDKQRDFALIEKDFNSSKKQYFETKKLELTNINDKLILSYDKLKEQKKNKLANVSGKLSTLDPLKIVARGYSVAYNNGNVVKKINDVEKGSEIKISVSDGEIFAEVNDVKKGKGNNKNG